LLTASKFPCGLSRVEKTFTVEAIAERFILPLYSISILHCPRCGLADFSHPAQQWKREDLLDLKISGSYSGKKFTKIVATMLGGQDLASELLAITG
jgi:hypothetical protein